jgi:hypothetical protein
MIVRNSFDSKYVNVSTNKSIIIIIIIIIIIMTILKNQREGISNNIQRTTVLETCHISILK